MLSRLNNLEDMQQRICTALQLEDVYVVPGDCDSDDTAREEMGRQAALLLNDLLARTGLSPSAAVLQWQRWPIVCLKAIQAASSYRPWRHRQSRRIPGKLHCCQCGREIHGTYRMVHIPDGMSPSALKLMLQSDEQAGKTWPGTKSTHCRLWHRPG